MSRQVNWKTQSIKERLVYNIIEIHIIFDPQKEDEEKALLKKNFIEK